MCSTFFTRLFYFKFLCLIPVLRYQVVCCEHRVGVLLVVDVEGGKASHVVRCEESQITGSLPLLSDLHDLDILCEMEQEGRVDTHGVLVSQTQTFITVEQAAVLLSSYLVDHFRCS